MAQKNLRNRLVLNLPLLVGVLSMFCGWARDWRFASVVETTCPLLSAKFTIWLFVTWLTGIVKMVCVAIP